MDHIVVKLTELDQFKILFCFISQFKILSHPHSASFQIRLTFEWSNQGVVIYIHIHPYSVIFPNEAMPVDSKSDSHLVNHFMRNCFIAIFVSGQYRTAQY